MRPDGLRLSHRHRRWLHSTFAVLFLSGAIWWILHRWFQVDNGLGPVPHPAQHWLIPLHGAAAMVALIIIGTLIPLHMKRGWRAGLNRRNGITLIAFIVLLTLSGYALYYSGSEGMREFASASHTGLGLAFPAMLLWHILNGRRSRRS